MSARDRVLPSAERLVMGGLAFVGIATVGLVARVICGDAAPSVLVPFLIGALVAGGAAWLLLRVREAPTGALPVDWGLVRATLEDGASATAVTSRAGKLVCANPRYQELCVPLAPPRALAFADDGCARLIEGARVAWRDGAAEVHALRRDGREWIARLRRAGQGEDYLVWRFRATPRRDPAEQVMAMLDQGLGEVLGRAGVMVAVADGEGLLLSANASFARRALGDAAADPRGAPLIDLVERADDGAIGFARERDGRADQGLGLRVIPIALDESEAERAVTAFLLFDEDPKALSVAAARGVATAQLHELLAMLPLGLALAERDGRILFMNEAFLRASSTTRDAAVVYPSDLVVEEDKATVIEAVRRFAAGRALPGDLTVRLRNKPNESVALTISNAKGLGEVAVLLGLRDDSEQSTLKRQIAQATKMQAVGQLAGGVAHDFNNILTAIIGHCDLMAMRHTPGDIDHDDIQQIKLNSNRAAGLTRQLLAFSRQQTLRPQVLQLTEVVAEITSLLRRLLGETVALEVKHGRNLGPIRADPGQLEQVIVNLAVNARDAMPDGGRLTLQTFAVSPDDVRRMRSDIMPIDAYTALKVSDTGCGIPPDHLTKIFEPFFTTKEVGKGTGLGLSTVYGIVKQTDGFIFANSEIGVGTSFVIYLPVYQGEEAPEAAPVAIGPEGGGELWGTGTILLVEDEAMVRAVGERALSRQGYRVLTAASGEDALEMLAEGEAIDLLISDVVMPGMDGPTLVRRARDLYPALRIVFMSGYAEEQLREAIDIDRVAFLSKPFSVQQLGQAARDALAQG